MIVGTPDAVERQSMMTPALRKALAFLRSADPDALAVGRVEIDGDRVYALVQEYESKPGGVQWVEGHRRYIDLQYVAKGQEAIGWTPIENAEVTRPYDEARDAWFGTAPAAEVTMVRMRAGQVAVLYPTDAHAPMLADGEPVQVKKIVVKVAL